MRGTLVQPSTISVFTRQTPACPKKNDRYWKRCKCRKWLYISEGGKDIRIAAGTRSWKQAAIVAQVERDSRDPVQQEIRRMKDEEAQKVALAKDKNITVSDATRRWLLSEKPEHEETASIYARAAKRINEWAEDQEIVNLGDVTADILDLWRGKWGKYADKQYNRIGRTSQSHFLGYLKMFFRYAVRIGLIASNPAQELKTIAKSEKRTQVLTPQQFDELLAAIQPFVDSQTGMTREFGCELRALFLLQRWSGLRILDCLMLPRSALVGNNLQTRTKKTGAKVDCNLPNQVVDALLVFSPDRKRFLPGYFLWNRKERGTEAIAWRTLSTKWGNYIRDMRPFLPFTDAQGKSMGFHSHMLRDTYAVEMLLAGVILEDVSKLLTHESIKVTEDYYGHWVPDRLARLKKRAMEAMERMGATFTPTIA